MGPDIVLCMAGFSSTSLELERYRSVSMKEVL